jgi:hypothetical protein
MIAYFYCDFRNSKSQVAINVIGSLVAQLIAQSGKVPGILAAEFDNHEKSGQQRGLSKEILIKAFELLTLEAQTFILIDALDECENLEILLQFLGINSTQGKSINILVTSRGRPDIADGLIGFTPFQLQEKLREVDKDIRQFVGEYLQNDHNLQWLKPTFKNEIADSLQSRSAGM